VGPVGQGGFFNLPMEEAARWRLPSALLRRDLSRRPPKPIRRRPPPQGTLAPRFSSHPELSTPPPEILIPANLDLVGTGVPELCHASMKLHSDLIFHLVKPIK
jgi:hypothetical protein